MKKSKFSPTQIAKILKELELGKPVPDISREYDVSSSAFLFIVSIVDIFYPHLKIVFTDCKSALSGEVRQAEQHKRQRILRYKKTGFWVVGDEIINN